MKNPSKVIILFILFCSSKNLLGQQLNSNAIKGIIKDEFGKALEDINVLIEGTNKGAASNTKGYFEIRNVALKAYTLIFSGVGIQEKRIVVKPANGKFSIVNIQLKSAINTIQEVVVVSKTEVEKIEETSFSVNAIDVEDLKAQNAELTEVLKGSEGIRIRLSGGIGSRYTFSLNGLSNNRIRFFADHIPVTYLGSIYDLNNIPVNIVSNVEVYKGVVPIFLGSDALGGAVNINTFKSDKSFIDASYSYGSFNTNKLTINSQYRNQKSGFTIRPKLYYLSSDNNYKVYDKEIYNDENEVWEVKNVERFHDFYSSSTSIVETGFSNVNWADEFLLGHSYNSVIDDEQTDIYGNPRGEVFSKETSSIFSFKYNKKDLLNKKLALSLFSIYNEQNAKVVDTSSNRYNWSGEITRIANDNTGELFSEKTLFEFQQKTFMNRAFVDYAFNEKNSLSSNVIFSNVKRQGENRLGDPEEQPFKNPNELVSTVFGLGYKSELFEEKLRLDIGTKYYKFNVFAQDARFSAIDNSTTIEDVESTTEEIGYFLAARWFILPKLYVKASFEKGVRFPEVFEIFGLSLIHI